jgi:uncharacterized iron-regulated membrane protein
VGQITLPRENGDAAMVRLAAARPEDGDAPQRPRPGPTVFVDPVSLAILGVRDGPALPWLRMVHDIHGNLLSGPVGRQVVGWLGVAMLTLGLSGLVLWWPKPRALIRAFTFNTKARGAGFLREIHRLTGIWSLLAFLAISFTGVAIVFPQTIAAGIHGVFGAGSKSEAPRGGFGAMPVSADEIDAAVTQAQAAMGEAKLLSVAIPRSKKQPYRFNFASPANPDGVPPVIVTVKPEEHRVEIRDPAQLALADRLLTWFRPTHEGQGLGPVWHAVVFAVGFLPLFFAVTGVWMWLAKRRMRLRL